MGFLSFLGRLLLASFFIFSAWQMVNEFAVKGPAAKEWYRKIAVIKEYLASKLGEGTIDFDVGPMVRHFVFTCITVQWLGGLLFVFGTYHGANLLIIYLLFTTPFLYDFYNYNTNDPEFFRLVQEFVQCISLLGALLYFGGMKNTISMMQTEKKATKPKAF